MAELREPVVKRLGDGLELTGVHGRIVIAHYAAGGRIAPRTDHVMDDAARAGGAGPGFVHRLHGLAREGFHLANVGGGEVVALGNEAGRDDVALGMCGLRPPCGRGGQEQRVGDHER